MHICPPKPPVESKADIPKQKWEVPPAGWLKCNVDGAFYEQQWKGAT
jgi:hypothetical protein